jgi:hypothetical protein
MLLIGLDYHPSFQQIAFFIEETGECGERQLNATSSTDSPRGSPSLLPSSRTWHVTMATMIRAWHCRVAGIWSCAKL